MAVAFWKFRQHRVVEFQRDRWIDGIEAILLVDRLSADNCPLPRALFEEIVEPSPAGDVDDHFIARRPLTDVHLYLRDRPGACDFARPPGQRVQDVHAALDRKSTRLN